MSQSQVKASRRELRRAMGEGAVSTLESIAQSLHAQGADLGAVMTLAHQSEAECKKLHGRIDQQHVDHARELEKSERAGSKLFAPNRPTLMGRLRWLLFGK